MEPSRRRQNLGRHASSALPALWKALARLDWSHADLARKLGLTNGATAKLLYGDTRPDLTIARVCLELLGIPLLFWDKPCPPTWRPHRYPDLRARAARQQSTGTDG